MSGPKIVCVICGKEAGIFSPICNDCSGEAVNGICCDDDQIQKPRDPYGCENPVSQLDEGD